MTWQGLRWLKPPLEAVLSGGLMKCPEMWEWKFWAVWRGKNSGTQNWAIALFLGLSIYITLRVFMIDIFPFAPNDTAVYQVMAEDPVEFGMMYFGTKQIGYPLFLKLAGLVSQVCASDPMFVAAMTQRLLLLFTSILCVFRFGIYGLPIVYALTLPNFLAFNNILYPEGLLMSFIVIFVALVTLAHRLFENEQTRRLSAIVYCLGCFVFLLMALIKIQYIVFSPILCVLPWLVLWKWKHKCNNKYVVALCTTGFISVVLLMSFIRANYVDYGVFGVLVNVQRIPWVGAYELVFTVNPENRKNPKLADFYLGGKGHRWHHALERDEPSMPLREKILEKRRQDLLKAAGLSPWKERFWATLWAIGGGRKESFRNLKIGILKRNFETHYFPNIAASNWYSKKNGIQDYLQRFNRGKTPGIINGLSTKERWGSRYYKRVQMTLVVLALAIVVLGLEFRIQVLTPLAGLASYLTIVGLLGYNHMDFWRHALPPWSFIVSIATFMLSEMMEKGLRFAKDRWLSG